MLCGKIAAGKSSLAAALGAAPLTVIVSEDKWMAPLFGDELKEVADYIRLSARLRAAMAPHVVDLLKAGMSVVLDYPANTLANRAWMKAIADAAGAPHQLHWLDVSTRSARRECGRATRRARMNSPRPTPISICSPAISWSRPRRRGWRSSCTGRRDYPAGRRRTGTLTLHTSTPPAGTRKKVPPRLARPRR
jgi:predicted kinase